MTQEVEVTLKLEVNVINNKKVIEDHIKHLFQEYSLMELVQIKSIKEEAELYGNE